MLRFVDDHRNEAAIAAEEARVQAERERVKREAEARKREEEERRRQEQERIKSRLDEMESWHRSHRLRIYLDEVRSSAIETYGQIEAGSELDQWLTWAGSVAESLDPLRPPPIRDGEVPKLGNEASVTRSN